MRRAVVLMLWLGWFAAVLVAQTGDAPTGDAGGGWWKSVIATIVSVAILIVREEYKRRVDLAEKARIRNEDLEDRERARNEAKADAAEKHQAIVEKIDENTDISSKAIEVANNVNEKIADNSDKIAELVKLFGKERAGTQGRLDKLEGQ
jgi:uncharacterized membrane protein YhiD involved in acid resistance